MKKHLFSTIQTPTLLITGLGLILLSSCSSEDDKKQQSYVTPQKDLSSSSCQFTPTDGMQADFRLVSQEQIKKSLFDKTYNSIWVNALMSSSMNSASEFISQTGVRLYKANAKSDKSCLNFEQLSTLPADLQDQWSEVTKNDGKESGYVVGLYLEKNPDDNKLPSTHQEAAIILRNDGNKWVLLHEFFHHNFQFQSSKTGFNLSKTKEAFFSVLNTLDTIEKDDTLQDVEKIRKQIPLVSQFLTLGNILNVNYPLEEISIETELMSKFKNNEFLFVPRSEYNNAAWYICSSARKVSKNHENVKNLILSFVKAARELGITEEELSPLDAPFKVATDRLNEAKYYALSTKSDCFGSSLFTQLKLSQVAIDEIAKPCKHSDAAQQIILQGTKLFAKSIQSLTQVK